VGRRGRNPPESCRDVIGLLTEYMEGGLSGAELAAMERHLEGCAACAQYLASLRTTRAAVASLGSEPIPEEVVVRLRAFLRRPGTAAVC